MRDASDTDLLREYARQNSEAAFAELVRRHVNLVYSAALRHVGMAAHAEEITQAVFVILARKAASLRKELVLEAWLFETTRLTALSFMRGERRRQFREQEAYMGSILQESAPDVVWQQLAPLLDEAMMRLGRHEREAVVLRFFKGRSLGEVAAALNIKEPAAQKRVSRALEKLRNYFAQRGVDSTTSAIAETISANSIQVPPMTLAKSVTAAALAKGATASVSTSTLIKGALKIMAWTKAKTAMTVGTTILLAVGITTTWIIHHEPKLKPQPVAAGQTEFPKKSWHFAGYGDPESAIMSTVWALDTGDGHTYRNSLSPAMQKPMAGKPDGAVIAGQKNQAEWVKVTGYRILDKEVLSENEAVLNCFAEGLNETQRFLFQRVDNQWKYAGPPKN